LAASGVGGNLTATATTGNITDSGTVTVGGTASFTTSAANADIDLGTLAATGNVSVNTNGATGNATVVNSIALKIGALAVGGNLTATATTGNLTANLSGAETILAGGTVRLVTVAAGADILGPRASTTVADVEAARLELVTNGAGGDVGANSSAGKFVIKVNPAQVDTSGVGGTAHLIYMDTDITLTPTGLPGAGVVSANYSVSGTYTITVDCTGFTSVTVDDNTVLATENGILQVTNAAGTAITIKDVELQTTGGNLSINSLSVSIIDGATAATPLLSTAAGSVIITTANGFSMAAGTIEGGRGNTAGGVSIATGNALDINHTGGAITASGSGAVQLNPARDLVLNGGSITSTQSGPIQITATNNVTLTAGTVNSSGTGEILVTAGGKVSDSDATPRLIGTDLRVDSAGGVGASAANPLNAQAANLAVRNTDAGVAGVYLANTGALSIGGAGGALLLGGKGVTNNTSTAADGFIRAASPLAINAPVVLGGSFTFQAGDSAAAGDNLTINADVTLTSAVASTLAFVAGDNIIHTSGTVLTNGGGAHTVALWADHEGAGVADGVRGGISQAGGGIQTGTLVFSADQAVSLNQANHADVIAGVVSGAAQAISYNDTGSTTIGVGTIPDYVPPGPIMGITGQSTVTITAVGSVNDAQDDMLADITGTIVTIAAGGSIGGSATAGDVVDGLDALEIDSTGLNLHATGAGAGITVRDLGGTELAALDTLDSMILVVSNGNLTVGGVTAGTGTAASVDISTSGSINDAADDSVTDITGTSVTLNATTGIGGNAPPGAVDTAQALEISSSSLRATGVGAGAGIVIRDIGGTTLTNITTLDSPVTLFSTGNLLVGSVVAGVGTPAAVSITTSGTGTINDAADDMLADIAGTIVTITAGGSIGGSVPAGDVVDTSDALEIDSTSLNLHATGAGAGIAVRDLGGTELTALDTLDSMILVVSNGNLTVGGVTAGTGTAASVDISTSGSINDAADDSVTDITGTNVTLNATTGIGGNAPPGAVDTAQALEISSSSLRATGVGAGAGIVIRDIGGTTLTNITTLDSPVTLFSTGNLLVGSVVAGVGTPAAATITATGTINDAADDLLADITGTTVTISSPAGIGGAAPAAIVDTAQALEVVSDSLIAHGTAGGAGIVIRDLGGTTLTTVDTTNSAITLLSTGNLAVGSVIGGTGTAAPVSITTTGQIQDAQDDLIADVTGSTVTLSAGGAIGGAAPAAIVDTRQALEVDTGSLAVTNTAAGSDAILNALGLGTTNLAAVSTNGGDFWLNTAGSVDITGPVATLGGDFSLIATNISSQAAGTITTTAVVRFNAVNNVTQAGVITAGSVGVQAGGSVTLGLANQIGTFAANATGPVTITNAGTLTVGRVLDAAAPVLGVPWIDGITTVGGDIHITSNTGSVIILKNLTANSPGVAGDITIAVPLTGALRNVTEQAPLAPQYWHPDAVIIFGDGAPEDIVISSLGAVNGTITLGGDLPEVPGIATIWGKVPAGFTVRFIGDTFIMGQNSKFTSTGSIKVSADNATVGDIAAAGDLRVVDHNGLLNPSNITYLRRAAGDAILGTGLIIRSNPDNSFLDMFADEGMEFVAGGELYMPGLGVLAGAGPDPTAVAASGDFRGSPPPPPLGALPNMNFDEGFGAPGVRLAPDGTELWILGIAARGMTATSNLATALASALPGQQVDVSLGQTVDASLQEDLVRHLGIYTRGPTVQELLDYLSGRKFYNDAPESNYPVSAGDAFGAALSPSDNKVSIDRLPGELARKALEKYREIYWRQVGVDPKTGKPIWKSVAGELRKIIEKSVEDFKAKNHGKFDPVAYRKWVASSPGQKEAAELMAQLESLFHKIELLGLGPVEQSISFQVLARSVKPGGLSLQETICTILNVPVGAAQLVGEQTVTAAK